MAFHGLTTSGEVHPCLTFYHRMSDCIRRETLPTQMCIMEGVDWLECVNKRKQVILRVICNCICQHALNFKVQQELHKKRILELPQYDRDQDKFVSRYQNATQVFEQHEHHEHH